MLEAVSLTKHVNIDQYSGHGIVSDRRRFLFHILVVELVKIFAVDMSSSTKMGDMIKDILILGKNSMQGLEHTLSAEKMYSVSFTEINKQFSLSLDYNGENIFLLIFQKFMNLR